MLMADGMSNLCYYGDLSAGGEEFDFLPIDLESLFENLGENLDPAQNSPEDVSVGQQKQGQFASDDVNNEHSLFQMVCQEFQTTFGAELAGSVAFSPLYNTEASDSRVGVSNSSFGSLGNSIIFDYEKKDASTQSGSATPFLANSMMPIPGHNSLDGSHNPFLEKPESDINCGKYCVSAENGFKTSGPPEIMETSMMDMDILLSLGLDDTENLHCMSNNSEIVTEIKNESDDLPSQVAHINGMMMPEAQVGEISGTVLGASMTGDAKVSGLNIKCDGNNFVSQAGGNSCTLSNISGIKHDDVRNDMMMSEAQVGEISGAVLGASMTGDAKVSGLNIKCDGNNFVSQAGGNSCTLSNISGIMQVRISDELVASQGIQSASFEVDATFRNNSFGVGDGFPSEKRPWQLLSPILPSNSSKKLLVHATDDKDLLLASKRACHNLDNIDKTGSKRETKLPRSLDAHLSKVSCRTIHNTAKVRSHVDDDSDLCIIEDRSEPSRPNLSSMTKKPLVTSQHSTYGDPLNRTRMGGARLRVKDESLIYRVVLQDLSQPKTEALPPDGVLAVPLLRHQRIALAWMVQKETASLHCSGGILADDQGLGKTISTIALILKERAPSSTACSENLKNNEMETLNLDEDDDFVSVLGQSKQGVESCQVVSNGISFKSRDTAMQATGRPAAGTLVVCPTSVLRQWAEELHNKVTSKAKLSVLVYHGRSRTKDPLELAKYDVVVTTYSIVSMEVPKQPLVDKDDYETIRQEACAFPRMGFSSSRKRKYPPSSDKRSLKDKKGIDNAFLESTALPLARVGWFRVVLDEAQSIKNHRTQVARACWGLRAKRRWCLSGTPIQNAVDDLYSYFRFLRYDPYAVYKSFFSAIKFPISRNPTKGYKKLQAVLKTIMLRRTKGTLLDGEPIINLPPKSVELKKVDFTKEERDFYCRLEADSRAQFEEYAAAGTVKQNYVNILLMLLRLRQACDHPLLVRGYNSSSAWRSSVEVAKKLPREKQVCLLNCLEASLAICGICNDPPEDAVVTSCGHVFCNQCICEHLTGDDNQCPTTDCKTRLSSTSVFSRATLKCSLCGQPDQDSTTPDGFGSEVSDKLDPTGSLSQSFDSSKIKAALEVLQSLSKPRQPTLKSKSNDENATCLENSSDPLSTGSERTMLENINSDLGGGSNDSIKVAGEKAIVFSQWTRMLDLLENCLKNSSIQYRRLDGTMSIVARDKAVKDFNALPEVSVMIMSLKAASLGLNMVAACRVLLLDLWWNPTTEDQAVDRAHRIGQTRPVTVLRLTVKDTVEDRILALQQKKRRMVASAFGEDDTGSHQTRLTVEDLKYLFMA